MSLTIREQSEQLQAASAAQLPADVVEVFSRNSQQLRARGVPAGTVKVADTLPSFTLRNAVGERVSLDDLVAPVRRCCVLPWRLVPVLQPGAAYLPA